MRRFGTGLALTLAVLLAGAGGAAAQEAQVCTKIENHFLPEGSTSMQSPAQRWVELRLRLRGLGLGGPAKRD